MMSREVGLPVAVALAAERLALKPESPFNRRMWRLTETPGAARL